jgi:hypothetical protein
MKMSRLKALTLVALFFSALGLASPASAAPPVIEDPGWCAQFYPNANCTNYGRGNPYTHWPYGRRGSYAMMRHHGWRHRHHH